MAAIFNKLASTPQKTKSAPAAKSAAGKAAPKRSGKKATQRIAHVVLKRPHVTEKAGRLSGQRQYIFMVQSGSTKQAIAQAVYEVYGIRPEKVRKANMPGKARRLGRTMGRIGGYTKAIVTLPEGTSIDITNQ
jgi:large subunit ribosomal protein L23